VPGESAALRALTATGLVGLLLWKLSTLRVVDLDVFHEMALFRAALAKGSLPLRDPFAYTPTVFPMVHHEWGMGAILWALWERAGWGPMCVSVLRYALLAILLVVAWSCVRRRGADAFAVAIAGTVALQLVILGLSPVRAQLFTIVLVAALLFLLDLDRSGARWWIPPWLLLCALWVNVHGGYVVGMGVVAATMADRAWAAGRLRPPWGDLRRPGLVLLAMCGLLFLTPYGWHYPPYLLRALTLRRPLIGEWLPLWDARQRPELLWMFAVSVLLVAYAIWKSGVRPGGGFVLLALLAIAALLSARHLPLYAIAFFAWLAPALTGTELVTLLTRWWERWPSAIAAVALLLAGLAGWTTISRRAWEPIVNERPGGGQLVYPVRAVDHLAACGFSGNLLTTYEDGSYVLWRLGPNVKVSIDSRFEAAYPPGLLQEHLRFFSAQPGWQDLLVRYPADAVLVPRPAPVAAELEASPNTRDAWPRVYQDATYAIHLRRGVFPAYGEVAREGAGGGG
jgi:hypothetical protein